METVLVTGGAGFIGSNFVRYWLNKYHDARVINVDSLTYAGCLTSLDDVEREFGDRYIFVKGDIGNYDLMRFTLREYKVDVVVNFAAESHNSRALLDTEAFFQTNTIGAQNLFQACLDEKVSRVHHISTCEVFGDLELDSDDVFTEESPLRPRTPYNAAKAGGDLAAKAYRDSFHLPITVSHCSNNYGPYQFPEKLIPYFTIKGLKGDKMPLYKSSQNRREWLHVEDHCEAIDLILRKGKIGESYNIGSGEEASVEEIADMTLDHLKLPQDVKTYVQDRPGHDKRYLLDSTKIRTQLGWAPKHGSFTEGIKDTIQWYIENEEWWSPLLQRITIDESQWKGTK